jgi:segregation and condensation protein A
MTSEYFVKLERFEGPLDLLLHLIRVHEIDIFAIDIFKLTTEYLNYLRLMKFDDLADAGAFIEMAATLIEIKSRSLLPTPEGQGKGGEDDDDDPVKTLQERLIQYELFRRAAEEFAAMPQLGVEIQTSCEYDRLALLYEHIESPLTGDPATLIVLYEQMLRGLAERKNSKIEAKTHTVSLEQTIDRLSEYVHTVRFALFQGLYNRFASRYELIVNILAVLELAKVHKLKFYQQDLTGPLWVYRADCDESILPLNGVVPQYEAPPEDSILTIDPTTEVLVET